MSVRNSTSRPGNFFGKQRQSDVGPLVNRSEIRVVSSFRTSSLADLAMRGSAISFLTWASVELLSFFLFDMS